jgi:hypothetical protein
MRCSATAIQPWLQRVMVPSGTGMMRLFCLGRVAESRSSAIRTKTSKTNSPSAKPTKLKRIKPSCIFALARWPWGMHSGTCQSTQQEFPSSCPRRRTTSGAKSAQNVADVHYNHEFRRRFPRDARKIAAYPERCETSPTSWSMARRCSRQRASSVFRQTVGHSRENSARASVAAPSWRHCRTCLQEWGGADRRRSSPIGDAFSLETCCDPMPMTPHG